MASALRQIGDSSGTNLHKNICHDNVVSLKMVHNSAAAGATGHLWVGHEQHKWPIMWLQWQKRGKKPRNA